MKLSLKITIVVLLAILLLSVGSCSIIVGINNSFVKQEQTIKAQYDQNKNNYDNYFKKLKEVCQVPDMYVSDLKKIYDTEMRGRYGAQGSQAMFQFIKEHNLPFDASLYKQIQQVIESGRNDFETNQKMLIDKKRVYETMLGVFPDNIIASFLGFPKIDLNKMSIITSDETESTFESKKSGVIKLR